MSEVAQAIHSSPDGHIPQLRFPEFSGEWMTDELSNLIEISSNKFNPNTSNESKKCIELEHLSQETGELLGYTDSTAQASTKNAFTKGQVLFGKLRPYLKKFWLSQFDGVCSSEIWVLNGKKLANNYLFQFIQTNKFNQIANVSSGSKMPRSDWKYMVQVPFKYTTKPEQQKIAAFLTAVDTKIEQLSNKKALLGEYKKGLMQQIFSQAIRFKADDGSDFPDWEEKKLGDVCKLQGGYAFKSAEFQKHGIPIIRISNISNNNDFIDNRNLVYYNEIKNSDKFIIKNGDLIVAMSGATTGKSSIYNLIEDAYLNQRVGLFKANNSLLDYGFLIQIVFSYIFATQLDSVLVAGAQPNVSSKDIEGFEISLPSKIEQNKIANFLSSIDSKIEQVGKQLDESKQFKKALLQQMFV